MGTKEFNFLDKIIARMRLRQLKKYIDDQEVILDFGCGHQALFLHGIKNKIKLGIGVDYEVENKKIGKTIKLINFRYIDKLPFRDNYFDKIFMLAVIEHFNGKEAERLFSEARRILKPKKKLMLTTPTPFGKLFLEFLAFKLNIISRKEISDHKKYYSKKDFEDIAKKKGFSLDEYKTFQFGINSLCVLKKMS